MLLKLYCSNFKYPAGDLNSSYLGLLCLVGCSKTTKRKKIGVKDRVFKEFSGWKKKLLSQAGKEVLIKNAIQNHYYAMLSPPQKTLQDIFSMILIFFGVVLRDRRKRFVGRNGLICVNQNVWGE